MKQNNHSFAAHLLTSVSYLYLYFVGVGYPAAFASIIIMVFRLVAGSAVLINSRRAHYISLSSSVVGLLYIAASYFAGHSLLIFPTLFLEVLSIGLTFRSFSRIGKTKQPSPLDMPVYG